MLLQAYDFDDQYKEGALNHPAHKLIGVRINSMKILISSQVSRKGSLNNLNYFVRKKKKQFKLLMWSTSNYSVTSFIIEK
jgi:hypothetical protein